MTACPLCESLSTRLHLSVGPYRIVSCGSCDFQWVDPRPTSAELAAFYNDPTYFTASHLGYANYLTGEKSHRRLARARLRLIERLQPIGTLIDFGCAAGFFLDEARLRGWRVAGIEVSGAMRELSSRVAPGHVFLDSDAARQSLQRVDVVTMWEYIEHAVDPLKEMRAAGRLLRPGGLIAISTPNTEHWLASAAPAAWREYKPPAHLCFFTARTLRRSLEATGFAVVHIRYTNPLTRYDGIGSRVLTYLERRWGSGADRHTRGWWIYSILQRAYTSPARLRARLEPHRYSVGLEVYGRRH